MKKLKKKHHTLDKPCPMFLCDCKSIATILALSWEIQCESHSLTLLKVDL
jgi:hypothetical protein